MQLGMAVYPDRWKQDMPLALSVTRLTISWIVVLMSGKGHGDLQTYLYCLELTQQNDLRWDMAVEYSIKRSSLSWVAVLLTASAKAIFKSLGTTSPTCI